MMRDVRMGLWTGLLGGAVTAVIAALADLAGGGGLDAATGAGSAAGLRGPAAAALALLVFLPLLSLVLGVLLACVPLRAAGAASGLAIGAAGGLAAALAVGRGDLPPEWGAFLACGLGAGLVTGFLYSRYARARLRPASSRPFARG